MFQKMKFQFLLTKKIFLTLFIIHCLLIIGKCQWILQHDYIPYKSFHSIVFINQYTGWVCGDGIIKKTTNGGINWISQNHEAIDKDLYCIFPIDSQIVYCIGCFETILKTTNGGNNWYSIRNGIVGTGASYYTTYFLNESTGWITGSSAKILKTTNGGISFDSISTYYYSFYKYDIKFRDAMTGITVGEVGGVFKSTNGGYNWLTVNIPLNDTMSNFYGMSVYQNQYCYLPGSDGRIFYSSDFGSNWIKISKIQTPPQQQLYCCFFVNQLIGWAGGEFGILYKTTNGGYNWRQENVLNFPGYNQRIWFYNTLTGWVTGGGCKILFTETGGEPLSNISNLNENIPNNFELFQNYPNPFNPITKISYDLPKDSKVSLVIYDMLGREIIRLVNGEFKQAGHHSIVFNGSNLASGVYFYRIETESFTDTKRMILIK